MKQNVVTVIFSLFSILYCHYGFSSSSDNSALFAKVMEDFSAGEEVSSLFGEANHPLIIAALLYGTADDLKLLLDHGYDPNVGYLGVPSTNFTVSESCDLKKLKLLKDYGADTNRKEERFGVTGIHLATKHTDLSCLKVLVDDVDPLNVVDNKEESPLFYAIDFNNSAAIEFLWSSGFSLFQKNSYGIDAVHWAVLNDKSDLIKDLLIMEIENRWKSSQ